MISKLTAADERYLDLLKKCLVGLVYDEGTWEAIEQITLHDQRVALPPGEFIMLRKVPFDRTAREEGRDWPALGYTMMGTRRLDNLRRCVEEVLARDVPGDGLEAGVWRGGSGMYMRALLDVHGVVDRTIWLADSFEGMPVPTDADNALDPGKDLSGQRYLRVSEQDVRENFRRLGLRDEGVRFLKGWFKDTLPTAPVQRLALLRLDGDLYTSTAQTLAALYRKVSPGGFVIVDDYYSWKGCGKATDDFRRDHGITTPIQRIDWCSAYWQVPVG
jgi:O-methyltransferase